MTVVQRTESSQRSRSSARELSVEREHDAINETATMSSHGPRENPPIASSLSEPIQSYHDHPPITSVRHAQTQTSSVSSPMPSQRTSFESPRTGKPGSRSEGPLNRRVQFGEFVEQLREQKYFENKKHLLEQRKRVLQKTITLSARLHRVSSWIGDGLVEISEQPDEAGFVQAGFVRVHQHMQNLIDLSYSQWDNELYALDPLGKPKETDLEAAGSFDVLSKLSSSAQTDLFDLLSHLRSSPRFLVERFKVLSPPQIISLWNPPRWKGLNAAESEYGYFTHTRSRLTHQRVQSYSKLLEEYASSFERSNPLSFLLFNMYGTNQSSVDAENQLRLSTWSAVCAELMLTSRYAYNALIIQLLDCFTSLYEWRAKDSVEMFLMDLLQRGAFLLDHSASYSGQRRYSRSDPLTTPQAQKLFDDAVHDLFKIFVNHDGGFPTGALQFASAMLDRLPNVDQQMDFRGVFFSKWFLEHFLQSTISYPENENMLLKFHVGNGARQKILRQLWLTIRDRVHDVYSEQPSRPVDPDFRICVETVVGKVDSVESFDPYMTADVTTAQADEHINTSITISISEIVQVLEALSPQAMHGSGSYNHFLYSTSSAFYEQYARASGRFDRLKRDLIMLLEPGSSTTDSHPCQEQWLQLDIDLLGKPVLQNKTCEHEKDLQSIEQGSLDSAQQGALRLFTDRLSNSTGLGGTSYRNDLLKTPSLETLFQEMSIFSSARLDPINSIYWEQAFETLHRKYPLSILVKDDSAVLQKMFQKSKISQVQCRECCSRLEVQLSVMEEICLKIRHTINKCVDRFDNLRFKIWYSVGVIPSKYYDDARNIARALNNMATSNVQTIKSSSSASFVSSRPMSPRSASSSIFEQPYEDTINMMKASSAHGGPKKLSDQQIELTKNWLEQTHIENFCKGEERIHRFCMEVYTVVRHLVGESLSESPVLWASDLFSRERSLFDIRSFSITSAPASTRPASVVSDTMSTSVRSSRATHGLRSADSLRMALLGDRSSNASSRIDRKCLHPELASSLGSLSRAHSATTADSISSVFTPLSSHVTRSLTSASVYSRSASVFNDPGLTRFTDTAKGKVKFLEKVRQTLVCLLLSDLGCPVWSLGSETDAMLKWSRKVPTVNSRLKQRMVAESLAEEIHHGRCRERKDEQRPRSKSASLFQGRSHDVLGFSIEENSNESQQIPGSIFDDHVEDLTELLKKLSQQVDPMEKLAVVEEFYELSLTTLGSRHQLQNDDTNEKESTYGNPRRRSLDDETARTSMEEHDEGQARLPNKCDLRAFTAHDIVQHLKSDLATLRPKTIFRDLQYISAFVPTDYTDNTPRGKALLQLGLAALAYKDEVCRSMVDVADKTLSQNENHDTQQQMMPSITDFWMFAAREGNAVAQRELASLYLSRPELLPVISLPLSMPMEIFKSDRVWHERNKRNTNMQALCLALHWMQQASANGDRLAKQKLEERKLGIFIQ